MKHQLSGAELDAEVARVLKLPHVVEQGAVFFKHESGAKTLFSPTTDARYGQSVINCSAIDSVERINGEWWAHMAGVKPVAASGKTVTEACLRAIVKQYEG